MPVTSEFREFARDLFSGLGQISVKRMFGGAGLYSGKAMFALIVDDVIYLKSDDTLRASFEVEGCEAFSYETKAGKRGVMSFMQLPEAALDDPDLALDWARKSMVPAQAAARAKAQKKAQDT